MTNFTNFSVFQNATLFTEVLPTPLWFHFAVLVHTFGCVGLAILIPVHWLVHRKFNGSDILLLSSFVMQFLLLFTSLLWCIGVSAYQMRRTLWLPIDCPLLSVISYVVGYSASWIGFLISVNRFIAILIPLRYAFWSSRKMVSMMLTISFLISLCIALVPYLELGASYGETKGMSFCSIRYRKYSVAMIITVFGGGFPIFVMAFLYIVLFVRLAIKRSVAIENQSMKRRIALGRILAVSSLWYCLCFLPGMIVASYNYFGSPELLAWMRDLFMLGVCSNPVIFLAISRDYQQTLRQMLDWIMGRRTRITAVSNGTGNTGTESRNGGGSTS